MLAVEVSDPVEAWVRADLKDSTPQSAKAYRDSINFILRVLSRHGFSPDDPDAPVAVANALHDCVEMGHVRSTISGRVDTIRRFWRWLNTVHPGAIPERCFDALKVPRAAEGRPMIRVLSPAQQAGALNFARQWRSPRWPEMHLYTFVAFGLLMALRPHELLHLDWSELYLDEPAPYLRLQRLKRRKVKNPLARQALTLPAGIVPLLELYFVRREAGPLFPVASDTFSHRTAVSRMGEAVGAPWMNTYVLRRTCITNWHRQGIELQRLTILSRHANPVVLNRHYLERPPIADINTGLPVACHAD